MSLEAKQIYQYLKSIHKAHNSDLLKAYENYVDGVFGSMATTAVLEKELSTIHNQQDFPVNSLVRFIIYPSQVAYSRPEVLDKEWMLANIISYDLTTNKYIIEDVSEEDESTGALNSRLRFTADPHHILKIFPEDEIALKTKIFSVGEKVIGLFPNTTCLYNATVASVPSKKKKIMEYQLQFENDEIDGGIPWRIVPARFVLERPRSSS